MKEKPVEMAKEIADAEYIERIDKFITINQNVHLTEVYNPYDNYEGYLITTNKQLIRLSIDINFDENDPDRRGSILFTGNEDFIGAKLLDIKLERIDDPGFSAHGMLESILFETNRGILKFYVEYHSQKTYCGYEFYGEVVIISNQLRTIT